MKYVVLFLAAVAVGSYAARGAELPVPQPAAPGTLKILPDQRSASVVPPTAADVHVPCWVVRSYVWMHGEAAVVDWATKNGYGPLQIASIRARCVVR